MEIPSSHEIKVISRNYSQFRMISQKWVLASKDSPLKAEIPSNAIKVAKSNEEFYITSENFSQRYLLKTNEILFKQIQNFWHLINPSKMRSISRKVYFCVFEYMYSLLASNYEREDYIKNYVVKDAEIDFEEKTELTFGEFYDSFFEFVDCNTKSKLLNEYARFVKRMHREIEEAQWFSSLNVYGKLHLRGPARPTYHAWMHKYLRKKSPENLESKPKLIDKFVVPISKTPETLCYRTKTSNTQTGILLQKINRLTIRKKEFGYSKSATKSTRLPREKLKSSRSTKKPKDMPSKYYKFFMRTNPLSTEKTLTVKPKKLLEDIIHERKTIANEILRYEMY